MTDAQVTRAAADVLLSGVPVDVRVSRASLDALYSSGYIPASQIGGPFLPTNANLALDPSMQSGIASAQLTGSTKYTLSYDTTIFHSASQSAMVTRTTTTLDTTLCSLNVTPTAIGNAVKVCATAGQVLSFSLWMRCSVANWQSRLSLVWRDSTGATIGAAVTGPQTFNNPANTWLLVKFENVTAPATTAMVTVQGVSLTPSGNAVGGELTWCDDLMINQGPTVQPYGDGSMPGWVWASGASRSVSIKGLRSLAQVNRCLDPAMEASLTGWPQPQGSSNLSLYTVGYDTSVKRSGVRSFVCTRLAATPGGVIASAYYAPLGTTASQPLSVFVTPGEIISTGVWMRCSVDNWRSQTQIYWRDATGAGVGTPTVSGISIGNPANTWVWVTHENVLVPAGAVMALFLGAALMPVGLTVGGEQAWYDDVVINAGATVQRSWNPTTEQVPGGGAVWLTGVPTVGPAVRPIGPWSQWDGTTERVLDLDGLWDGAALQPVTLADVAIV